MKKTYARWALPPGINGMEYGSVHGISFVGLFWSLSTMMVFSLLPAFLTENLHLSYVSLGFMEGCAIFLCFSAKVFCGVLSDCLRSRKPLIIIGGLLTIASKPLIALAWGGGSVFFARCLDRFSKGIRSAPTDALIADLSPKEGYGYVYGYRQAVRLGGNILGAVIASALCLYWGPEYQRIFFVATLPAFLALVILLFYVKQPPRQPSTFFSANKHLRWHFLKELPLNYWYLIGVVCVLMLARFSLTFVSLRMKDLGLPLAALPSVMIVMDITFMLVAYLMSRWADHLPKKRLLAWGIGVQCIAAFLMQIDYLIIAGIGVLLIGVYMGLTHHVLRAMIAEETPANLRGTAFAIFYLAEGIFLWISNSFAGFLADNLGVEGAFAGGTCFTLLSLSLLLVKPVLLRRYGYGGYKS